MHKQILITGATDGIGFEAAKLFAKQGHSLLLHGRNAKKLENVSREISELSNNGKVETCRADFSILSEVEALADKILATSDKLDVLINNAGVLKAPETITAEGLDIRFAVNTIAPYLLTTKLLPLLGSESRVINLSAAAQTPVNLDALSGMLVELDDMAAYSQSKLAITMWSASLADSLGDKGPVIIAVNPGSLLASKMVKEGFGVAGNDLSIGAEILVSTALDAEFSNASGQYFDNDKGHMAEPHSDALDSQKCEAVTLKIKAVIEEL